MKAAVLILSDKGAAGKREDLSGPALIDWLSQKQVETTAILAASSGSISDRQIHFDDSAKQ